MATEFISNSWLMPTNANAEANRVSNYSLDFDGSNDTINCGNITSLNGLSGGSWSFWLNSNETSTQGLFNQWGSGTDRLIYSFIILSSGRIDIFFSPGNLSYRVNGNSVISALNINEWFNLVIVFDGTIGTASDRLKVYINGQLLTGNTSNGPTSMQSSTTDFIIGTYPSGTYFDGKMTEISIFDYSLSASQVTELYGTGSAIGNPMAITNGRKPVAYYPLGNSAFNGEFLASNGAEQDYVFNFVESSTQYIDIGTNNSNLMPNDEMSISLWVKFSSASIGNYRGLFSANTTGGNDGYLLWKSNTNLLQFLIREGGAWRTASLSPAVVQDVWYHVVGTWDGTNMKIYVDNVVGGTTATASSITYNASTVNRIGDYATYEMDGDMSNVQFWNKGLSAANVTTLYNNGTPYTGTQPEAANLQGWWKLNASATFDGSNWSIPDASSNSNTGTSSGMTAANLVQSDLIINAPYDSFSLDFDGTNDFIDCGGDSSLFPTTAITVSIWVKASTQGNFKYILAAPNTASYPAYGFQVKTSGASQYVQFVLNTGSAIISPFADVLDNNWHNVVSTYDGSTLKMFVDGLEVGSGTSTSGNIIYGPGAGAGAGKLLIGDFGVSSLFFTGKLSNVSIYNSALSAAQITTLYNEHKPFDLNNFEVTPVAWWRLGAVNSSFDGTNWTVLDEIGTSNGTSANMTQADLVDGVGATGSGTSSGMSSGTNKTGDAPYSTSNAVSYNMSVLAKSTSVPT